MAMNLRRVLLTSTVICVAAALLAACDTASGPHPESPQQSATSSFCGDLGTLNIGIIQTQALNPSTIAGANDAINTSYQAVRQQALSVPHVNITPLTDA